MPKIRKASSSDVRKVYEIRNDQDVLKFFFDANQTSFEDHCKWFEAALSNKHRVIFIVEDESDVFGVVRFDLDESYSVAEVSIFIAKKFWGRGLGTYALSAAESEIRKNYPTLKKVSANVIVGNISSQKIFEKAGYIPKFLNLEKALL